MSNDQMPPPPPPTPSEGGPPPPSGAVLPGVRAAGPIPPPPGPYWPRPPRRSSTLIRVVLGLCLFCLFISILMNVYLLAILAIRIEGKFERTTVQKGRKDQTVAVYTMEGVIDTEAARHFARFCAEVKNDNVKAVVLRVDSPGGGVTSADQIHHLIGQLRDEGKKVVVSMGGVATSGGYYVSAGADEILAEPTTVTGSIGAIMGWVVIRGTLEKIGMEMILIKSTSARGWKDEISSFKLPDPRQRKHLQEIIDKIQEKFEGVVRKGRGGRLKTRQVSYPMRVGEGEESREITVSETEPLNGKIYLAEEAEQLGLVDGIGYLTRAIDRATDLAALSNPRVVRYDIRRGLLSELFNGKSSAGLDLDLESFEELQTPRVLLMWKAE